MALRRKLQRPHLRAPGNTLADGTNIFTLLAQNAYGVRATNIQTLTLPASVGAI